MSQMTHLRSGSSIPNVLSACLILVFLAYLGWQTVSWNSLVKQTPTFSPSQTNAPQSPLQIDQLAALFGATSSRGPQAHVTRLNLQLHGSFVHSDPTKSSALISRHGEKPQRFTTANSLDKNTRLHHVHRNHVELMHNGQIELLPFPESHLISSQNRGDPGEFNGTETPTDELLADQATALREQMEAATAVTANDDNQPLESESL